MDKANGVFVADQDEKEVLRNLLEKYLCEFSQYDECDVNAFGLYGYSYLDNYFTERNRYPFIIRYEGKIAGFAFVGTNARVFKDARYVINEFYILPKYRRKKIGSDAAKYLFDMFPGKWEIVYHPKNRISVEFWENTVSQYTSDDYTKLFMCGSVVYNDGSYASALCFSSFPKL